MLKIVDWVAELAVPESFGLDPSKRAMAAEFRATARLLVVLSALTLVTFALALLLIADFAIGPLLLFLAAGGCGCLAMGLIRATRTLTWPLAIASLLSVALLGLAIAVSGGLISPLLPVMLAVPSLTIGHADRRLFAVTMGAVVGVFIALSAVALAGQMPLATTSLLSDTARTLFGGFAGLLLGVAGWVAQSTYRHTRMAALATSESLAEKNAMLETLSGKLSKYLAPQVFASIFAGTQDVKVGAKRKKLTVYFADIVDFTKTTDALEAEDLSHLMNEYFGHMAEIILKHGGTIDKYIGDAIMVFFGDPETNGAREDAIACVDMALEMEARLNLLRDKWLAMGVSRPLQMRAGINTGYCTVGNFGSENRMDYTIIGGQVNIAARLEQAAKPGTILVSHQTQALVHEDFDCVEHGQIAVKGIREPVTAYRVGHSTSVGEKQMLIHEKLDGMSLVIDPNSLSAEDRNTARRYLARAIDRLKD